MAPWKRWTRLLLLAVALACLITWGAMVVRLLSGARVSPALMWWSFGTLMAGWAAFIAYRALGAPDDREP